MLIKEEKQMKKIASGVLALAVLFGSAAALPAETGFENVIASANDTDTAIVGSYYGFEYYTFEGSDYKELTSYTEDADTVVTIPSVIDNSSTISLSPRLISYFNYESPAIAVTVGPYATAFGTHSRHYFANNGVLYALNPLTNEVFPVIVPNGMNTLTLKEDLTSLLDDSDVGVIANHKNLWYIDMPKKIGTLGYFSLFGLDNLMRVEFPKNCTITKKQLEESKLGFVYDTKGDAYAKNTSFVISCYSGSAAEKYAKAHGFKYWLIDKGESGNGQVSDKTINVKELNITLNKTSYKYTGKAKKPIVNVKFDQVDLIKDRDYKLTYKNNTKIGTATVTIKGLGNFSGTKKKTFKIVPEKVTVNKLTSPKTKQLKITYKKAAGGVTGYEVTYSTSKKFTKKTTKTVTVKGASKLSKTVKKLKKGKTYYVKVRAYKNVSGKKYAGAYSAVKKVKVK